MQASLAFICELKLASFVETQGLVASKLPSFQPLPDPNPRKSMIFLSGENSRRQVCGATRHDKKNHLLLKVSLKRL